MVKMLRVLKNSRLITDIVELLQVNPASTRLTKILFSVLYNLPKFLEFQVITEIKSPALSNFTSPASSDSNSNDTGNHIGEIE